MWAGGMWAALLAGGLALMAAPIRPAAATAAIRPAPAAAPAIAAPATPAPAPRPETPPVATYADLADLADSAELVLKLKIREVAPLEPARAPNLRAGWARLYIEAEPLGVLLGPQVLLPRLRYLLDVPLDARGHRPELKRHVVLGFARSVMGKAGDLQLVAADGQLPWSAELEARTRGILTELAAPGAPGRVTAVSEVMYVPGTLAGEGETQIFLATQDSTPAAITVTHQPGQPPRWSVSFSEVVDTATSGLPPPAETLTWYRLACFLPDTLPGAANVSETPGDREQAAQDYLLVRVELGECARLRS